MGSEDSKKYNQSNNTDFYLNISYTSSDFKQIKTINSEESMTKTKTDKKISSKENEEKIKENKYCVTFEWTGGGSSVYVSGDFCNWNQFFLMPKISEGKYILKLEVKKKGLIQYKFKIDNEWKINQNFPSLIDHGNLNNFIDTSKLIISKDKSELTTDANTESSNKYSENINQNLQLMQILNLQINIRKIKIMKLIPDLIIEKIMEIYFRNLMICLMLKLLPKIFGKK